MLPNGLKVAARSVTVHLNKVLFGNVLPVPARRRQIVSRREALPLRSLVAKTSRPLRVHIFCMCDVGDLCDVVNSANRTSRQLAEVTTFLQVVIMAMLAPLAPSAIATSKFLARAPINSAQSGHCKRLPSPETSAGQLNSHASPAL